MTEVSGSGSSSYLGMHVFYTLDCPIPSSPRDSGETVTPR